MVMNTDAPIVKIENLKFSYGKHIVFEDVSLNLEKGKIYGLLGENGVGKTTLMRMICGLLRPMSGNCTVCGISSSKRDPLMLKDLFYIPEIFIAPAITVDKFAATASLLYPSYDKDRFVKNCETFGVERDKRFDKLSQGQQKKALIAFALALRTKLLLMDEPSNGLDIPSKTTLRRLISESITDDSTFVISTHQVRDLENIIDPIIILDRGGIILNADMETITGLLKFTVSGTHDPKAFYSEENMHGYSEVVLNSDKENTRLNMESLFNAALNNKETFKKLFKNN